MSFERALSHIFSVERGFVNHPADRGGPTNFGITLKTLEKFRKTPVTIDDVRNLSQAEAGEIYRQEFWDANALFLIGSSRVQNVLFDQIVARGGHAAIIIMQKVLNSFFRAGLRLDGEMGPVTSRAINLADESLLGPLFIREVQKAYVRQCALDPSQLVFVEGWLGRSFLLFDLLFEGVL